MQSDSKPRGWILGRLPYPACRQELADITARRDWPERRLAAAADADTTAQITALAAGLAENRLTYRDRVTANGLAPGDRA